MLLTGQQKLERMRDGRRIFVGGERIDDVTTHPAFRGGAATVAALYDAKHAGRNCVRAAEPAAAAVAGGASALGLVA